MLLTVGVTGTAFFARCWLLARAVEYFAPRTLEAELGYTTNALSVSVRETESGLIVDVDTWDVVHGSGTTAHRVSVEDAEVVTKGWGFITSGLEAVRELRLDRVFSRGVPNYETRRTRLDELSQLRLPRRLPDLPLPITINEVFLETDRITATGSLSIAPPHVSVEVEELRGPVDVKAVSLDATLDEGEIPSFQLEVNSWGLSLSGALLPTDDGWGGTVKTISPEGFGVLNVTVPSEPTSPIVVDGNARVNLHGLFSFRLGYDGPVPDSAILEYELSLAGDVAEVDATVGSDEGSVTVNGTVTTDELALDVVTRRFDAGALAHLFLPELAPRARVDARIDVRGRPDSPSVSGTFDCDGGSVLLADERVEFEGASIAARWREGEPLRISDGSLSILGGEVTAIGRVPMEPTDDWRVRVEYQDIDLAEVRSWLPFARDMRGRTEGSGVITGTADAPHLAVDGDLIDGVFAGSGWERITDVTARYHLDSRRIDLDDVQATIGGGRVSGSGTLGLTPDGELDTLALSLDLERVRLARTSDFRARGSGHLELSGNVQKPRLSGTVDIIRGVYDRNFHPQITARGTPLPFHLFSFEKGFASRLELDVTMRVAGKFLVRNNRIEVAPTGELQLGGTGRQPVLVGSVNASDGTLELPNLKLGITRLETRFPKNDPYRPTIDFQGQGRIGQYEISAIASGSMLSPEVTFTSTPFLPEEDVLLLVATGYLRQQVEQQGLEAVAALELARLYGPGVWERVFGRSRKKSLLDDLTVSITEPTESDEEQAIIVELKLFDGISVAGERDHRGDLNLDVIFFRWFR